MSHTKAELLAQAVHENGYSCVHEMLQEATFESIVPAICTKCGDYTTELEPDADACSCCESCPDGGSVSSVLVIAGLI